MTKQELKKYCWLKNEIEKQKSRLEKIELKLKEPPEVVADIVKDYSTGKGIPVKIEGVSDERFTLPITIRLLKKEIEKNIETSNKMALEIEMFIQTIGDPKIRELMRSRYIDGLSWEEVGRKNYISQDWARQLLEKFLKELP